MTETSASATADSASLTLPDYGDVERAAHRIKGVAHKTPVLTSRTANKRTGGELFFKCENFQRGGAFKFRGAYNAIAALDGRAAPARRGLLSRRATMPRLLRWPGSCRARPSPW